MKRKMNGLYKTAFILMLVAAVLFIVATIVAYALERPYFSAVFSCSGAFLAFLGIIFATCSKPKNAKDTLSQMKLLPKMMISTKFRKILLTTRNKFDRMVADKGE